MNAADLLVHTSRQEPFGRTLLEAAASGLPVIATDVGGTSEMLRDNEDVVLVSADEPSELDCAITDALDSPSDCLRRSDSARQRVETEFSLQKAAEKMATFWGDQLSASAASE